MHIPDGFLSTPVWASLNVISFPALAYVARRAQSTFQESKIPLLGVLGAFVFAAQMVNFPVGAGASGHLVGGALLACTLGPAAAIVVMSAILGIQALLFQDGGVLALGANVLNLAIVGVLTAYLPYHLWGGGRFRSAAIFAGGVVSVLASASLAMAQIVASGVRVPKPVLAVSFALFLAGALLEGAITVAVIKAVERMNPDWLHTRASSWRTTIKGFAAVAIFLAGIGFVFASAYPDSLEAMVAGLGPGSQHSPILPTPFADYQAAFVASEPFSKAAAGLTGLAVVWLSCLALGRLIARRRSGDCVAQ